MFGNKSIVLIAEKQQNSEVWKKMIFHIDLISQTINHFQTSYFKPKRHPINDI